MSEIEEILSIRRANETRLFLISWLLEINIRLMEEARREPQFLTSNYWPTYQTGAAK